MQDQHKAHSILIVRQAERRKLSNTLVCLSNAVWASHGLHLIPLQVSLTTDSQYLRLC